MVQFGDCTGGTKTKAGNERGGGECVLYPWSTRQYNLTQKLDFKQRFPKHKVQKKECFLQRQPFHLCSGFSYLSTFITTFYHSLHSPTSSLSPSLINFFFFCFTPPDCLQMKLFFFFFCFNHKKAFSELASVSLSCDCDSFFATFFTSELLVGFITHNVVSQLLCFMLAIYSASYDFYFHSTWLNPTSQMQFISCLMGLQSQT